MELTILGSNSATPIFNRHPTAQVLSLHNNLYLIDCGEATQMQLMRYKVKMSRISCIFISHLHGDHYLGLTGLLFTMHLNGRTQELHLFAQQELMDILELQFRLSATVLRFNLIFHPLRHYSSQIIFEDQSVKVKSIIMNHRIPCAGFVFTSKPVKGNLIIEKLRKYNVPVELYNRIKEGDDFVTETGELIPSSEFCLSPSDAVSYAFCSDTRYSESILPDISRVDLLYHEATFLHDMAERAEATFHTTARQAAQIAVKASVKKLLIGHFSARYRDLEPLLKEARSVFSNTELAIEGLTFKVG
ncbi:MAG: ribonuclease Z [Bacteroidia bacterium]|nr:ribonuclease Z [Bacteroidia bacterium]